MSLKNIHSQLDNISTFSVSLNPSLDCATITAVNHHGITFNSRRRSEFTRLGEYILGIISCQVVEIGSNESFNALIMVLFETNIIPTSSLKQL